MDSHLTDYSKRFLKYLETNAPDIHRAIQPATDKQGRPVGFLIAKIEAPNRNVNAPLSISTEDDEITIGFDAFHAHFGAEESTDSNAESFTKALSLVREIMAERVLVVSWWLDGKWAGSQVANVGVSPTRPAYVDAKAALRVRSWTGQKDESDKAHVGR